MKKLMTAILMILSLNAVAGEIVIFNEAVSSMGRVSLINNDFGVNMELGRAWVVLKFTPEDSDGPMIYDERVKVPGLSYSAEKKAVVLDVGGDQLVCATVKKNFLGTFVRPTKACTFSTKYYTVKRDNGYEMETILKVKVIMNY
jgi:hypothetical protein